ncbi:MAG: META domain-containing protein [Oligoflexia bacterium]|nr:META domain-containing protein [Oligoflexia bacterium]
MCLVSYVTSWYFRTAFSLFVVIFFQLLVIVPSYSQSDGNVKNCFSIEVSPSWPFGVHILGHNSCEKDLLVTEVDVLSYKLDKLDKLESKTMVYKVISAHAKNVFIASFSPKRMYYLPANYKYRLFWDDGENFDRYVCEYDTKMIPLDQTKSCDTLISSKELISLQGTEWIAVEPNIYDGITLVFDAEDSILHGNSSCNNYQAAYRPSGEQLEVLDLQTTLMECEREVMGIEARYISELKGVSSFFVTNSSLELLNKEGTIIARFGHKKLKP